MNSSCVANTFNLQSRWSFSEPFSIVIANACGSWLHLIGVFHDIYLVNCLGSYQYRSVQTLWLTKFSTKSILQLKSVLSFDFKSLKNGSVWPIQSMHFRVDSKPTENCRLQFSRRNISTKRDFIFLSYSVFYNIYLRILHVFFLRSFIEDFCINHIFALNAGW